MDYFCLGGDVSKGYADFLLQSPDGTPLPGWGRFDDTPAGHQAIREQFASFRALHHTALLRVGVEASGGLERNWLRLFRELLPPAQGHVYQLNPLAVKHHGRRELHGNTTDALSARRIAAYLREGLRSADRPCPAAPEGPRLLYRHTADLLARQTQLQNQLHSLLPAVQPDLVRYCRESLPRWVLLVLQAYPTVAQLAPVTSAELAQLPYVTPARAAALITQAQQSVASLRDEHTALVVQDLATEILRVRRQVVTFKKQLVQELADDPEVRYCRSIPGIGPWTAVCLRLEYGSLAHFHSAPAVVAFAGLDPRRHQSGDQERHPGISRRGRKEVRRALFMATKTALRENPVIQQFYARLRAAGKLPMVAYTACMAKLLRLAYACVLHERDFDPHYQPRQPHEPPVSAPAATETAVSATEPACGSLAAPISRKEAQRRRTEAARRPKGTRTPPPTEGSPSAPTGALRESRGPGANPAGA